MENHKVLNKNLHCFANESDLDYHCHILNSSLNWKNRINQILSKEGKRNVT